MDMISILSPTRNRPDHIVRMIGSILATADNAGDIELILYIDDDDDSYDSLIQENLGLIVKYVKGPRIIVSDMWNKCYEIAEGPIYHHGSDDCLYRSMGWDTTVKNTFDQYQDGILLLYGRDGHQDENLGTLSFLHENWVRVTGYVVPPYFAVDWCDNWINDVALAINRRVYDPSIYIEHLHWHAHKSKMDQTYAEREVIRKQDSGHSLYLELAHKRDEDAAKLRDFMGALNDGT